MKAPCPHFGKCSGCTLQQFPYVKQLFDKTKSMRREFASFVPPGKSVEDIVAATVASPDAFGYRISSKLCLHEDDNGQIAIGLYRQKSKQVLDIPKCPVHHPAIDALIRRLFRQKTPRPAPFYNHLKRGFQKGRLKFLTVRYSPEADTFGIVLSHTGVEREQLLAWAKRFAKDSLSFYESHLEKDDADLVLSRKVEHLCGPELFRYQLDGRNFYLDPLAFFQANGLLAPAFIQHIVKDLVGDTLLDLYGGFGAYAFAARSAFREVHLVEANERAIAAAIETAKAEAWTGLKSFATPVEDFLQKTLKEKRTEQFQVAIVNPPRAGISLKASTLLCDPRWKGLKKLHYVSCNWETLRRDLRLLMQKGGFTLTSLTPFDMFPQTDHVELVAKLER